MVTAADLDNAAPAPGPAAGARGLAARVPDAVSRLARRTDVQGVVVLLLTALAVRSSLHRHHWPGAVTAVVLAVTSTAPLVVARTRPIIGLGLPVLSGAVFVAIARLSWPSTAIVAWLSALALCPLHLPRSRAVAALVVAEASVVAALFVPENINSTPWDATIAELLTAMSAWWVGESVKTRRDNRTDHAAVAAQLHDLAERDAVARERARIARELHDVVAHHVSTIAVRAATLPYEMGELSEQARAGLDEIADGARAALADLRAVLGVLRTGVDEADNSPQPRLMDLPRLVKRVQSIGARVQFAVRGPERPLPDGVQVCGYRIIQEALTNTLRYAPGSEVHVELVYDADDLTIAVRDDGPRPGHKSAYGADPSGGHGLVGMRERAAMLGGSLSAGRRAGVAGFEIVACVPYEPKGRLP